MPTYELESSSIWLDVKSVIYSDSKAVKFEYKAQLHTEKQDINILKIISLDVVRDYANHIGDLVKLKFKIPLGDYMMQVYPYRGNLEVTIKRITLTEGGTGKKANSKILVTRYKAVFVPSENPVVAGSDLENYDQETLNKADMVDMQLELLDRSLEPLRITMAPSNAYRGVTQKQVINNVLGGGSLKVLVDGKPSVDGIDIVEPDNKEIQDHCIIRDGLMLTSVPTFLQEKMGGVYGAGIGTYLQNYNDKRIWFVFPMFNTKLYDTSKSDKLIIYAVPQEKLTGIDRTFNKDGSILKIVATSNRKYSDSADVDSINKGVGFRMADARAFMKKPVIMTEDGPKGARTQLNHENAIEDRKDGLNFAPVVGGPSNNPYIHYSKISSQQVARVDLVWENSDETLIYPGMPVCYIFLDNNKPVELKGQVAFTHTVTSLQANGINSNVYKNVTAMVVLVSQVTAAQKDKNRKVNNPMQIGTF